MNHQDVVEGKGEGKGEGKQELKPLVLYGTLGVFCFCLWLLFMCRVFEWPAALARRHKCSAPFIVFILYCIFVVIYLLCGKFQWWNWCKTGE